MRCEGSRAASGCVKRSVKGRRGGKGKEWKEVRDAWREKSKEEERHTL